jgi:MoaA/NifB/PqqE/SkfB family radical SAM enzyme
VKIVRMNTNGSRTIKELEVVLKRGTTVIVTMSLDGTGRVHDYTRWPIKWENYVKTVDEYIDLKKRYRNLHLDFWTTVSCLNIENLPEIIKFAKEKNVPHDWAFLDSPDVLNVKYKNVFTDRAKSVYETVGSDRSNQSELKKFISVQDKLRKTSIRNYFNFIDI